MAAIESMVNAGYDLASDSLVDACRVQLAESQTCILPNFLPASIISELLGFVDAELPRTPRAGLATSTVYYQEAEDSYEEWHPKNRLVTRSNTYISADKIPSDMHLRKLQDNQAFMGFLTKITRENLVEYAHVSKFVFSVSHEGDHQDWHFDNNFLTLTFMLRKPDGGGLLEVYPRIGRYNFKAVASILDKHSYSSKTKLIATLDHDTSSSLPDMRTFEYEVGDMVIFYGRDSLHRSTIVTGSASRVIAIMSFNTKEANNLPNEKHMEKVYGIIGQKSKL